MKGTLFSGDFIKDELGNLRLVEFNTDTAAGRTTSAELDFSGLYQILNDNSLTTLDIIYKDIQNAIVERIQDTYQESIPSLQINLHKEQSNSIYPTSITETGSNFILRLVYDENAIFDSSYIKNRFNTFNLFKTNDSSSDIVAFSYTDDSNVHHSTIEETFLDDRLTNIPDVVIKQVEKGSGQTHAFGKVGNINNTNENRVEGLTNGVVHGQEIIEQYHFGDNSLDDQNRVVSFRSYSIIYGSELDILTLATVQSSAYTNLPTEIDIIGDIELLNNGNFASGSTSWIQGVDDSTAAPTETLDGDTYYSADVTTIGKKHDVNLTQKVNVVDGSTYKLEFEAWSDRERTIIVGLGLDHAPWTNVNEVITINTTRQNYVVYLSVYNFDNQTTRLFFDLGYELGKVNIDEVSLVRDDQFLNTINPRHYYEFATNTILPYKSESLYGTHTVLMSDGTSKSLNELEVNDVVKSKTIEGLDLDEQNTEDWQITGSTLTYTESESTASIVDIRIEDAKNNVVAEIALSNGDKIYTGIGKRYIAYNTSTNITKFEPAMDLDPSVHKLFSNEGNLVDITSVEFCFLDEPSSKLYGINVEDNDTYILGDSHTMNLNIITHNRFRFLIPSECLIKGTRVMMGDGSIKNIEDIEVGDVVLSFNEDSKINEPKKVKSLNNPIHDDLVTYKFSDHSEITSTFDHPFYVKDKGIASYLPSKTNLLYSLGGKVAKQIEVGDFVFNLDHSEVEIVDTIEVSPRKETETFIIHVEDNNNFYAEGILVHNKQE